MIDVSKYDFIDFGSGGGDFMDIAKGFGGKRGLGIENDPVRVKGINGRGKDCLFGDVRRLEWLPDKCVRFVTVNHLLEHMRTLHDARLVVRSAARLARDIVYIGGPNFDHCLRLAREGFKFYWADWPDSHPLHVTTGQLAWMLCLERARRFMVWATGMVGSSMHPDVHPLGSPSNSGHYDAGRHPGKARVGFNPPVPTQFVCLVTMRKLDYVGRLTAGWKGDPVVQTGGAG